MITVADALAAMLANVSQTGTEVVPLASAAGRVLAAAVVARLTQPPADVSAMDGYALGDGPGWSVIGAAPAGHPFSGCIGAGEAVRVFTGSVVPPGTVQVVPQEDVTLDGTTITVVPGPARHIRPAGQDFQAGDTLLRAGQTLTPRAIGLAAAANHPWVTVHRRPQIAILATGDEISLPGDPVGPGGIVSSNAHMVAALVRAAGADAVVLPIAADTRADLAAKIASLRADMLVTCGGASVGAHDLVQPVLIELGFIRAFWQVALRPGKPLLFGTLNGLPVLGLPGNPVSAFVCSVLFLRPAVSAMLGQPGIVALVERRLGAAMPANDRRQDYVRATRSGEFVTPLPRQDSSLLTVLASAESLIVRVPNAPAASIGDLVLTLDLDPY